MHRFHGPKPSRAGGLAIVAVLALIAIGCTRSTAAGELTGVTWTVASLPDVTIPAGLVMDATFRDDGTVEGSDGCNSYGGRYSATDDGGIDIGGLGGTLIGCEPAIADAGAAFTSALEGAASYEVDGEALTLFAGDGAELVRLRSNASPPVAGLTWRAFGYRDGPVDDKQAVVSLLAGSEITAEFGVDGTMNGSSGCNTYTAAFESSPRSFSITNIVSTERGCEPSLLAQEAAYLDALRAVERWKFSGPSFQLLNGAGTVQATYAPS